MTSSYRPLRSALGPAILLALSPLLALPAQAQWSNEWEVLCSLGVYSQVACENRPRFPYADAAAFHEAQLEAASRWLAGLDFAAPFISTVHGGAYVAEITDTGFATQDEGTIAAYYVTRDLGDRLLGRLDFVGSRITYPGQLSRDEAVGDTAEAVGYLGTAVHELFHAVQAGEVTPDVYARIGSGGDDGDARDWIFEGTAEAVMSVWLDRSPPVSGQDAYVNERYYDSPLDDPAASYGTWHFWRSLGREVGARDDVQYLKDLLQQDLGPNRGIDGVHEALKAFHGDGLYHYYPAFIARHVNEERLYEHPRPIELTAYRTVTLRGRAEPLAAEAFVVRVAAPGTALAGLAVELEEPHRDDPALHLIADADRYDTPEGGGERNVFRTAIDPSEGERTILVRVANVAENPSASVARDYTIRLSLQPSAPCSPGAMMSTVREAYWNDQQSLNTVFSAAQRAHSPLPLPGGEPVVVELVRPAEEYLADFEPQAALHPAEGAFSLSGLVEDGGIACTEPLGTNGMRAIISGAQEDPEAFEQHAEEAAQTLVERIQQMSPEELAAMRESGMDAIRRLGTPGQGGEGMLAMGQEALEASMGVAGDRPVLLRLFAPNAFAWQSDLVGVDRAIAHTGLGGWKPNTEAQVIVELLDVGAGDLRERDAPYRARLFTWAPDMPVPLYTRWEGEEYPVEGASAPYLLSELAFEGVREIVEATALEGHVWITEITGAEVRGRFALSGEGTLNRTATAFELRDGIVVGDRVVDREEGRGPITLEGTFSAPSAMAFDRAGRVITRTLQVR